MMTLKIAVVSIHLWLLRYSKIYNAIVSSNQKYMAIYERYNNICIFRGNWPPTDYKAYMGMG